MKTETYRENATRRQRERLALGSQRLPASKQEPGDSEEGVSYRFHRKLTPCYQTPSPTAVRQYTSVVGASVWHFILAALGN